MKPYLNTKYFCNQMRKGRCIDLKSVFIWFIITLYASISVHAQTASDLYREGYGHQRAGRLDEAIQSYRKAIELNKDYADAHYQLGRTYYLQAKEKNRIVSYAEPVVENGLPIQTYNPKWEHGLDELDLAIIEFEEVVRIEPKEPDANSMLGLLNHNRGRYDVAIEWHKKAIALAPTSLDAQDSRHDLALIYYFIKKDEATAITLLKKNLEINPSNNPSKLLLSQIEKK